MLRCLVSLGLLSFTAACASSGLLISDEAMARAQAEVQTRRLARDYSRFAVARYASLTDDPKIAAQYYADVARSDPGDTTIAERAIFSALLVGDVDDAAKIARKIPEATLKATELPRLTLAIDAFADGRERAALGYLQSPWTSGFHAMLGRSLVAWIADETDPDVALRLQATAGGDDPVLSSVSQTITALMKMHQGDVDSAQADFERLWNAQARLAIGAEANARQMALSGNIDGALKRIKDFQEEVGRNPTLTALAREIRTGTVAPQRTLSRKDGAALAIYAATAALSGQNNTDLPGIYFALALHLDPDLYSALTLWADTLDTSGRRDEAIKLLSAVPKDSIHHTSAQGQLAWVLRREGRNDEALALAQETLARTEDRNIRIQLADLLQSLGRDGEAEATLTDVIKADESEGYYDWRIYFARGAARERLRRWPPAESDLKTALGLKPDSATILNYLGYSWIDRGINLDEGLALIEKAVRLSPRSGSITDSLGWAHYKLSNYDRAIFYLERATELDPQNAEILDHLGDAYWQVGRYLEAGYQWERALTFSGDAQQADRIQKKLNGGQALLAAAPQRQATPPR